jgi:hypothetical protein
MLGRAKTYLPRGAAVAPDYFSKTMLSMTMVPLTGVQRSQ